jgi:hypothetical protein
MIALAAAATAVVAWYTLWPEQQAPQPVVEPVAQTQEQTTMGRPTVIPPAEESIGGQRLTVRERTTDGAQRTSTTQVSVVGVPFETVMAALQGDEQMLRSLRMSDEKLDVMLCASTGDRSCIREASTVPCPAPVMATSLDGRGRVFSFANCQAGSVDPNKLVAVAAKHDGQDVLMWYPPTQDFLAAMPDSIQRELSQIIEIDVQDDGTNKHIRIRTSRDGEVVTEDFRPFQDTASFRFDSLFNGMGLIQMKELERLGGNLDKELQQSMQELKLRMQDLKINMDSMGTMLQKMRIRVRTSTDSANTTREEIEINMPEIEMLMDGDDGVDTADVRSMIQKKARVKRQVRVLRMNAPDAPPMPLLPTPPSTPDAPLMQGSLLQDLCAQSKVILIAHCSPNPKSKSKTKRTEEPAGLQETGRTSAGAVTNTSVFPNPTSDGGATIGYTLAEPRTLGLALHDLTGNKVLDLAGGMRRPAGSGQLAFTLPGVAPGMYLVTLTTDKGETAVQRLIVNE